MKKKLKVEKAFRGKIIRRPQPQLNPVVPRQPGSINTFNSTPFPRQPGVQQPGFTGDGPIGLPRGSFQSNATPFIINPVRPGVQQPGGPPRDPNMFSTTPPRPPQLFTNGIPATPNIGAMGNPISQPGGMGPLPNNLGPMQQVPTAPVGDPRRGGAFIPGNRMQEMMRTAPAQQAAPVQPVPAMKRGGVVRGGRAETKGTRPAKLY